MLSTFYDFYAPTLRGGRVAFRFVLVPSIRKNLVEKLRHLSVSYGHISICIIDFTCSFYFQVRITCRSDINILLLVPQTSKNFIVLKATSPYRGLRAKKVKVYINKEAPFSPPLSPRYIYIQTYIQK